MVSMSRDELLALPVSFGINEAGRALGMGREKARTLYHAGRFPIKVRPHGNTLTCTRHELFAYLGLADDGTPLADAPAGPDAA